MTPSPRFRRLAWVTTWTAAALVVLGGVVRITGSGMGCGPDWPLCDGRLIPPLDLETAIEYGHRLAAAAVSVLVLLLAALAWTRYRREPSLRNPATLGLVLLASQVLLGAVTVKLETQALSVILHFGNAMALLAALSLVALRARATSEPPPTGAFTAWAWAAAGLGLVVILLGAAVANLDAGMVCRGFPLCNGRWLPADDPLIRAHWGHRQLAYAFTAVVLGLAVRARREAPALRRASWMLLAAVAVHVAVAAAMVLQALPLGLRALHLGIGTLIWLALVRLMYLAGIGPARAPRPVAGATSMSGLAATG